MNYITSIITSLRLALPWSSLRMECINDMDTLEVLFSLAKEFYSFKNNH